MGKQSAINVRPLNMYAGLLRHDTCVQPHANALAIEHSRATTDLFLQPVGTAAWLAPPYLHIISRVFARVENPPLPPRITRYPSIREIKVITPFKLTVRTNKNRSRR